MEVETAKKVFEMLTPDLPEAGRLLKLLPVLLNDSHVGDKFREVIFGEKVEFHLFMTDNNKPQYVPLWDRLTAATMIAHPHHVNDFLLTISNGIIYHQECRLSRLGIISGILRGMCEVSPKDHGINIEYITNVMGRLMDDKLVPALPKELESEQGNLLAKVFKSSEWRSFPQSLAQEILKLKCIFPGGIKQLVDNFSYKYFSAHTLEGRLALIARMSE